MSHVTLCLYDEQNYAYMKNWIPEFYQVHAHLFHKTETMSEEEVKEAIQEWTIFPQELYMIEQHQVPCGFLHIDFKNTPVIRLEHLYIDQAFRCQGIATQAIKQLETLLKKHGELQAIMMDVSPRNKAALHLYHALGYDNLCLLTMRKEFKENPRDQDLMLLDHTFHI